MIDILTPPEVARYAKKIQRMGKKERLTELVILSHQAYKEQDRREKIEQRNGQINKKIWKN